MKYATCLLLLLLLSTLACAGAGPGAGPGGPGSRPPQEAGAATAPGPAEERDEHLDPALARALEEAAAGGDWRELYVFAECTGDAGLEGVEIFADGVAIWDGERQFQLPRETLASLLTAFRDAGFAAMPLSHGGAGDLAQPEPGLAPGGLAQEVVCRVRLRLGGADKEVVQLRKGRQSEELRRLALAVLGACRELAPSGVAASSLADGLEKIAAGELDPRTMSLLLNRQPERAGQEGDRWLMRLAGPVVSVSSAAGAGGEGSPRRLRLRAGELARLTRLLADGGIGELPANLYADLYTDLAVEVLGHRQRIQARPFAGISAATHGSAQQRFDRVLAELEQLALRVLDEGEAG